MEDFLKNRPVLDPKSALVVAAEPKPGVGAVRPPGAAGEAPASGNPFGELRRDPSAAHPSTSRPAVGAAPAAEPSSTALPQAAVQNLKGEHGTKVQTVVERGRVTKIIVTCTCGKVTEIACQY